MHNSLPYSFLLGIGIVLNKLSKKEIINISVISLLVFVLIGVYYYFAFGKIKAGHSFKYPPQLYYTSYAIGVSLILFYLADKFSIHIASKKILSNLLVFIGGNTLWIYLWHTFVLKCVQITKINLNFIVAFFIVAGSAIAITHIQRRIVGRLIKNGDMNQSQAELLKVLFLK